MHRFKTLKHLNVYTTQFVMEEICQRFHVLKIVNKTSQIIVQKKKKKKNP